MRSEPMRPVDRTTLLAAIRGTTFVEQTADALVLHRLPEWTRVQASDPQIHRIADKAAGVHLALETAADSIELELRVHRDAAFPHPVIAATTLDGSEVDRAVLDVDVTRVRLRTGATGPRSRVGVWMPQNVGVELRGVFASAPVLASAISGRPRWVHHGSSISHGLEADGPLGTWPTVASLALDWDLTNLGLAGQSMLDPFVARTIRDLPAEIVTLKLGINIVGAAAMRVRTFVPAVHGFLDTIRDGHPHTPIVVISPIHAVRYGDAFSVADPGALDVAVVRELLAQIVERRSDPRLHILDGLALLGPADVDRLYDGLHPDAAGYRLIGERFVDVARRDSWLALRDLGLRVGD